jgi:hypothetical protein
MNEISAGNGRGRCGLFSIVAPLRAIAWAWFVLLAIGASSAQACITFAPFKIEDIKHADEVFSGKLLRYERVSGDGPGSLSDYGLLTVRVQTVLKGKASGDVQLYWWNSTYGVPDRMERGEPILVAAVHAGGPSLPLRGGSATFRPTQRPDILQILQAPCSSPFFLDSSPANITVVRTTLSGGKVNADDAPSPLTERDFFALPELEGSRRAEPDAFTDPWFYAFMTALVLVLLSLLSLPFWIWRFWRKRRRLRLASMQAAVAPDEAP